MTLLSPILFPSVFFLTNLFSSLSFLTHFISQFARFRSRKVYVDHPPPLLGKLCPGLGVVHYSTVYYSLQYNTIQYLGVGVVHGKVGDDDGDGEGDHQDPGHGAHRPHEHAQVGLGHHVTVTHCGHRDQRPPQPQRNRAEVVSGVDLEQTGYKLVTNWLQTGFKLVSNWYQTVCKLFVNWF